MENAQLKRSIWLYIKEISLKGQSNVLSEEVGDMYTFITDENYQDSVDICITDVIDREVWNKFPSHQLLIVLTNKNIRHEKGIIYEIKDFSKVIERLKTMDFNEISTQANMTKEEDSTKNVPRAAKTDKSSNNEVEEILKNKKSHKENKELDIKNVQSIEGQDQDLNDLAEVSKYVQHHMFLQHEYAPNRTIGVWSPLHRMGVTTFIMNFAIFLAKSRLKTAVLELPSEVHNLKMELNRFTDTPKDWESYAYFIHSQKIKEPSKNYLLPFKWFYENVAWYPLNRNDTSRIKWFYESMQYYIQNLNRYDVTLIDMPTGKMDKPTLWALEKIDELWILVDDNYQSICAYKTYIQQTLESYPNLSVKLIFNKYFKEFSRPNEISEKLGYPLLTVIPDMHKTIMKNYYENKPPIKKFKVKKELEPIFETLYKHITKQEKPYKSILTKLKALIFA